MKWVLLSLWAAVGTAWADRPLTLDPAVMDAAKRAVFGGEGLVEGAEPPSPAEQGDAALWQQAMDAAGTEMMPVLLLALLQRLNADKPMATHAALYADALRLHVLAAAGNKEARIQLAAALQVGMLLNGLRLICDAEKADALSGGVNRHLQSK